MKYQSGLLTIALVLGGCREKPDTPETTVGALTNNIVPRTTLNSAPATVVQQVLQPNADGRYPVNILQIPNDRTNGMPGAVAAMSNARRKPTDINPPLPTKTNPFKLSTTKVQLFQDGFVIKQIEATKNGRILIVAENDRTALADVKHRTSNWLRFVEIDADLNTSRLNEYQDRELAGPIALERNGARFVVATNERDSRSPGHLEIGRINENLELSPMATIPSVRGSFGIDALTGDSNGTFSALGWIRSLKGIPTFVKDGKQGRIQFHVYGNSEHVVTGPAECEGWPTWRVGQFDGMNSMVIETRKQTANPLLHADGNERITTTGLSRINLGGTVTQKRDLADLNMSKLWVTRPIGNSLLIGGDLNGEMLAYRSVPIGGEISVE